MTDSGLLATSEPLVSVVHICAAQDLEVVKAQAYACVMAHVPNNSYDVTSMLPTALSPTGSAPVTNYLCYMPAVTENQFALMRQWSIDHQVPSQLYEVTSLKDFLTSQGLLIVNGI